MMDWLPIAVLGIIWAAFLLPWPRRGRASRQFPDLREDVELQKDATHQPGRWVLAPKKGSRFVGSRERARLRARERRRRIVVVLLEAVGLTGLIGIFPPLRPMLFITAILALMLVSYLALVAVMVSRGGLDAEMPAGIAVHRPAVVAPQSLGDLAVDSDQERLARVVNR
jgi:hypothetical protein